MVESQLGVISRSSTPRAPTVSAGYRLYSAQSSPLHSPTPTSSTPSSVSEIVTEGSTYLPGSMPGDATDQSTSVRNRSRAANRRRPFSTGGVSRHSAGPPPPPSPGYPQPADPTQFQPSFQYSSNPSHFPHQTGYFGQYMLPSQPPPVSIGQGPLYSYPALFHTQDIASSSSPPLQSFPQQMQRNPSHPHLPHRHSDDGSNPQTHFPGTSAHHHMAGHPTPSPQDMSRAAHAYISSPPHFQAMGYSPPPPLSSPQYGYPHQYSPHPRAYQPFGAIHYPHPSSTSADIDGQTPHGSWYFVPHNQQPQYDNVQFRPTYQYQYLPLGQHHEPHAHVPATAPPHQQRPFDAQNLSASSAPSPVLATSSNAPSESPAVSAEPPSKQKTVVRREWHPRPPVHRSPWVMWVGNVPSDAAQEELWKFFTQIPGPSGTTEDTGVESIHLINRSNCAFINYSSEAAVNCAITSVNGLRLRPNDPQCPMLVCKIRRSMDDLQSGVGGQRGIGLHKQWVRDQQDGVGDGVVDGKIVPGYLANAMGALSLSPAERGRRGTHTSSSSSHASTSSSFLMEFFPVRYFILKSLSEEDLNLSVENGLWATQKHNELLLDQAFRTARDVYLIFSVNKSGEFFGYAKMIGPIRQGEGSVSWVSRGQASGSPRDLMMRTKSSCGVAGSPRPVSYFTPNEGHLVDASPQGIDSSTPPLQPMPQIKHNNLSAPPKIGGPPTDEKAHAPSFQISMERYERARATADRFELDTAAPLRAMRTSLPEDVSDGRGKAKEAQGVSEAYQKEVDSRPADAHWGECFKVEWLERRKIPFHRTRHLRNPWNKMREIKISRDGTELESSVGARLLEEWGSLVEGDPINN